MFNHTRAPQILLCAAQMMRPSFFPVVVYAVVAARGANNLGVLVKLSCGHWTMRQQSKNNDSKHVVVGEYRHSFKRVRGWPGLGPAPVKSGRLILGREVCGRQLDDLAAKALQLHSPVVGRYVLRCAGDRLH